MIRLAFVLLVFVLAASNQARASDLVEIKPGEEKVRTGARLDLLEDPEGKWTVEQVSSPSLSGRFRPNKNNQVGLGPTGSAWWLRLRTGPLGHNRYLEVAKANLDQVDVYFPTPKGFETHLTGDLRPAKARQVRARTFVFRFPKDYSAGQYVYLRLKSHTSLDFDLWIWTASAWAENAVMELVIFGLLLGAILAMSVYNFFIFLSIRDRAYLYCVICMTFSALYQAQLFGVNAVLFDLPAGAGPLLIWSLLSISLTAGVAFSRTFLDTPRTVPRLDKALLAFGLLSVTVGVLGVLGLYRAANLVSHTFNGLGPPFILVVGFIILRTGFTAARYFLLAWSFLLISIIIFVSGGLLFPSTFLTFHALLPAAVLEVILFSFALTDRIRTLQQEQDKLIKQQRRLTEMSITDDLTGLFNKRWFDTKLKAEMEAARKHGLDLSLVLLDVDHFKSFNDTYGHALGDHVLAGLGQVILESVRANDIACRYGGEEFALILPRTTMDTAQGIAERLRKLFEGCRFKPDEGPSVGAAISLGLTGLRPEDSPGSFFKRADQALYQAKNQGRNRTVRA